MSKFSVQKFFYLLREFVDRNATAYLRNQALACGYLKIGSHTYGKPVLETFRGSECKVEIGRYCSIAKNVVMILGGIHPTNWVSTYPLKIKKGIVGAYQDGMPKTNGNINVGSDVWLGTDVIILSGVTIGHGAIVAAGSIVTKDVEPYAIVGGNPARLIKYRFTSVQIQSLLAIRWWDWGDQKVIEQCACISSPNIELFIEKHGLDK